MSVREVTGLASLISRPGIRRIDDWMIGRAEGRREQPSTPLPHGSENASVCLPPQGESSTVIEQGKHSIALFVSITYLFAFQTYGVVGPCPLSAGPFLCSGVEDRGGWIINEAQRRERVPVTLGLGGTRCVVCPYD